MEIEWKESYSVGNELIDKQHKNLIAIINKLYEAIFANQTKEELKSILKELQKFGDEHFKTEEEYFKKCDYEGAAEQIKEHESFRQKLKTIASSLH